MNYIIGGGPAGLLAAFYNPDFKVIDLNPMGQLNLPFIPGPRVLKRDKYAEQFLEATGLDYHIETIKIGYTDEDGDKTPLTDDFKRKYSKITRGTTTVEKSFLSSGESEFEILTDGSEDFYFKVFDFLNEANKHALIQAKVTKIDLKNETLSLEFMDKSTKIVPYQNLVSTLPLKVFLKLANFPDNLFNFETKAKHFIQCAYSCDAQALSCKQTAYTYSLNGDWTRRTHFKDYVVYEMTDKWYEDYKKLAAAQLNNEIASLTVKIDGCPVIKMQLNIPIQIQNSVDIQNIAGVKMLGRFAQWNHKIKANEILQTLYGRG